MTHSNLTDFHSCVKTPLQEHEHLHEKLLHLREVLHFTLNIDLTSIHPKELHAQLITLDQLVETLIQFHASLQKASKTSEDQPSTQKTS